MKLSLRNFLLILAALTSAACADSSSPHDAGNTAAELSPKTTEPTPTAVSTESDPSSRSTQQAPVPESSEMTVTQASPVKRAQREILVLVPGFFNSFAPEYFSQEVINAFKKRGFTVYIASGLNPVGTIEDNGERLERILKQVEAREGRRVEFHIVAHSAGGFYSLWAAHYQKFNIKNIYTINTPYLGVDFLQAWIDNSILFKAVTELAYIEGLRQLTATGVKKFIDSVRVGPKTKVVAFAGYQPEGLDITDSRNVSVPLRITSHFIPSKNDGIVSYKSALGLHGLKTVEGEPAKQFIVSNEVIHLEHWEQAIDSYAFLFLGIRNPSFIANEQSRFYSLVANQLLKDK